MNLLFTYDKQTTDFRVWNYEDFNEGFEFYKCCTKGKRLTLAPTLVLGTQGSPRTTLEKYLHFVNKRPIKVYEFDGVMAFAEGWLQDNVQ